MIWFTSDEHYGHNNIIKHCNRPFEDSEEMDKVIIKCHNRVVGRNDTVYHLGDFCFRNKNRTAKEYIALLKGKEHIFLRGNHDGWLPKNHTMMMEIKYEKQLIVLCHYPLRSWRGSYRKQSWQLHGHHHTHGFTDELYNQLNVCVDANNFYPWSFDQVKEYMEGQ